MTFAIDNRGQVVRQEDGEGNYAAPGYDANGNKAIWVDRRGKMWQFTYDNEDRLRNTINPTTRTTAQGWNNRGLLETITEPSGQMTTLGYDGRRRLTSRTDPVGTVSYGLDDAGQLLTLTQGSAILTRTYHGSGQVATYQNANGETISYDYDKNGNLTSLTYPAIGNLPAATVSFEYDNRDRLTKVIDWSNRETIYSWDAAGKLTLITRPNGTKRRLSWDAAGQMLAIEERPATGAPLAIRSFGYDSAGRINKRLSYPQAVSWVEPAWSASYNDDNRMTSVTGGILNYDSDGNLLTGPLPDGPWGVSGTSSNASGAFTWNARNQLTRTVRSDNAQQTDYTYDAEGNFIQTTDSVAGTTRWIIDPNGGERSRILAKVAPNGDVTRYVYGVGLVYEVRQDGSVRYYHYDQVGSTVALTDESGNVTGRADYTPYGVVQSTSGELAAQGTTPFLFVGAYGVMTDSVTGLHQMRARWYSSHLRRFMSEDPAGFAGGENFYAYANGNPVNQLDPDGCCPLTSGASGNITGLISGNSGTPSWNALLNQSTSQGSPVYDPISQTVGYTGLGASALQYSAASRYSVGSNYKVYTSGWGGNGSVSTIKLGAIAEAAGPVLAVTSIGVDLYGYTQGNISGAHLTTNTTMTGVGFLGMPGAVAAGSYFLIDTFYPAKNPKAGGAAAFAQDVAPIVTKPVVDLAKTGAGMPIILPLW